MNVVSLESPTGVSSLSLTTDAKGVAWLAIDVPGESVNMINQQFVKDFEVILGELESPETKPTALILYASKPGAFLAGADLKLIRSATEPSQGAEAARRIQSVCDRLERLPFTTVAMVEGAALGGGLEIALACDYRVAAESKARDLGLVEVQLGLLPAGGGTQRLSRLIGPLKALTFILSSRRLTARQARRNGIVDDAVHPRALRDAALRWAAKGKRLSSPKRGPMDRAAEAFPLVRSFAFGRAESSVRAKTGERYPAPFLALEAVRAGLDKSISIGLTVEARHFGDLAVSTTTRNLIDLFLDSNDLKKEQTDPERAKPLDRVGIVGAGLMGAGIAQAAAMSGLTVRVKEISPEVIASGLRRIDRLVSQARRSRRLDRYEAATVRSRVSGSDSYSGFKSTDLVVEAAIENLDLKRSIVRELEATVSATTIIGTNTSAIPIDLIATGSARPENIVGIHFFSPVHKMPLVEVVRGTKSSPQAVETAVAFGRRLGKHVVVVNDGPGFFTTRVLGFMMSEAVALFEEGARIEDIDDALLAFGFPMGPMALMDEVGLDVAVHVAETLAQSFGTRIPESGLMNSLTRSDRKGKRSSRGFYLYEKEGKRVDPELYQMPGRGSRSICRSEIQERLSLIFVNEAARCLDEGIIASGRDGDIASIFGIGFPPFLGGPFRYTDLAGAALVRTRLEALAGKHGARFEPADCIRTGNSLLRDCEYPLRGSPQRGAEGELIGLAN